MNLKKIFSVGLVGLAAFGLAACGGGAKNKDAASDDKKILVVASPAPHAEILEAAKPILKKRAMI